MRTSLVASAFHSETIAVVAWAVDRATESWEPEFGPAVEAAVRRSEGRVIDPVRDFEDQAGDTTSRLLRLADRMRLRDAR